jgi:protein-ribulosamine 3-kinase
MEYVDTVSEILILKDFCPQITAIHRDSVSPERRFGFPVPSYLRKFPQPVKWEEKWAVIFARMLESLSQFEGKVHGPWLTSLPAFCTLVADTVPRLLNQL